MSKRTFAIPALFLSLALAAPVTMLEAAGDRAGIQQAKKERNRNQNRGRGGEDRCTNSDRLPMRFRGLDTNCDGVISRAEWRGNDVSFQQHDRNGDGVLSGRELEGNGRDDQRQGDRFDRLDLNDDGRISLDEWPGRRSAFERLDRNDDGFLSRDELDDD
jgi:EF hand